MEREIIDDLPVEDLSDLLNCLDYAQSSFLETIDLVDVIEKHPVFIRLDLQQKHLESLIEFKTRTKRPANSDRAKVERIKRRIDSDLKQLEESIRSLLRDAITQKKI